MTPRPVIACVGNCQSRTIRALLQATPEISRDYDVVFLRNRAGLEAVRRRIVACIEQVTHSWEGAGVSRADLPPGAVLIRYPAAMAIYPWPTIAFHRRAKGAQAREPERLWYPHTLCDSLALRLIEDGIPRDRFVEAYFEIDITARYPLDRLYEINLAKARQLDEQSDFGTWDLVESEGRKAQLFRTADHPNGPLMAYIMEAILDRLPGLQDRAFLRRLTAEWKAGPGIQAVEAPVHPDVAEHFDLQWAPRGRRYTFWHEGSFTFEEHLLRLFDFTFCEAYHRGVRALSDGRIDDAVALLRQATAELPRSTAALRLYATALTRKRDYRSALSVRRRVFTLEPSAAAAVEYARTLHQAGRSDEAVRFLADLPPVVGAEPAVLSARAAAARAVGRLDEANRWLDAAEAADPDHVQVLLERARQAEAEGQTALALERMTRAHYVSNWSGSVGRKLAALRERTGSPAGQ